MRCLHLNMFKFTGFLCCLHPRQNAWFSKISVLSAPKNAWFSRIVVLFARKNRQHLKMHDFPGRILVLLAPEKAQLSRRTKTTASQEFQCQKLFFDGICPDNLVSKYCQNNIFPDCYFNRRHGTFTIEQWLLSRPPCADIIFPGFPGISPFSRGNRAIGANRNCGIANRVCACVNEALPL